MSTTPSPTSPTNKVRVSTLVQLENNTWIENLAIRQNTALLVTLIQPGPRIYQVSPSAAHPPLLLGTIPGASYALGIDEIEPDVFAIAASSGTLGSNSIWKLDVRSLPHDASLARESEAQVQARVNLTKILDIPAAQLLNGMAALPARPHVLLAADSLLGAIFRIDTRAKKAEILSADPLFGRGTSAAPTVVNGLKVSGKRMFWSNSNRQQLGSVPIDAHGRFTGKLEVFAEADTFVDDIVLAPGSDAELFVATGSGNSIAKTNNGSVVTFVGGGTQAIVAGSTAVLFGREHQGEKKTLYVTTNGGAQGTVDGGRVGGKVLRLDVEC